MNTDNDNNKTYNTVIANPPFSVSFDTSNWEKVFPWERMKPLTTETKGGYKYTV